MHESVAKRVECMVSVLLRLLQHVCLRPSILSPIATDFVDEVLARMIDKQLGLLLRSPVLIDDDKRSRGGINILQLQERLDKIDTFTPVLLCLWLSKRWNEVLRDARARFRVRGVTKRKIEVIPFRLRHIT